MRNGDTAGVLRFFGSHGPRIVVPIYHTAKEASAGLYSIWIVGLVATVALGLGAQALLVGT